MTETKHTPGPWHIDWNGGMAPRIIGVHQLEQTREIADVRFHNGSDDPNVHANARLIAAAPELLAALEAMVDHFGTLDDNPMLHACARSASKRARAAITKAKEG